MTCSKALRCGCLRMSRQGARGMLEIVKFIKTHKNWRSILENKPYSLIIKEKDTLILFKYHQFDSDLSLKICQEARGLILEKEIWKVVRCAFFKFFNYGESNAAKINFNTMKVQGKIDGSLISLYYYYGWQVATNGMIDAKDAELYFKTDNYKTYFDLFLQAWTFSNVDLSNLNKNCTYTFELVSKYNRVVIPYDKTEIYHIGTRNNLTLEEINIDIGIQKPKLYNFSSIEDIITNANKLPYTQEGYVVIDSNFNRIKIKSPAYVAIHHLKGEGKVSKKRLLSIVRKNEREEFLNYFPEYKEDFEKIENQYLNYYQQIDNSLTVAKTFNGLTRKEFAMWAKNQINPHFLFSWLDGKLKTVDEFLEKISDDKLIKLMDNK